MFSARLDGVKMPRLRFGDVYTADSFPAFLYLRILQFGLSIGLDAIGFCVVWHHHAGALGGLVGVHARPGARVMDGRSRGGGTDTIQRVVTHFFLWVC